MVDHTAKSWSPMYQTKILKLEDSILVFATLGCIKTVELASVSRVFSEFFQFSGSLVLLSSPFFIQNSENSESRAQVKIRGLKFFQNFSNIMFGVTQFILEGHVTIPSKIEKHTRRYGHVLLLF